MDLSFALLHLTALMLIVLFLFTFRVQKRSQLYYVFLLFLAAMIAWTIGNILAWYSYLNTGQVVMSYVKLWYIGNCYVPVLLYFLALLFNKNILKLSWKYMLFVLPPTISYLTLLTNEINGNLFFHKFSLINPRVEFGPLFYFHTLVSYLFLGLGIYYLLSFTIKNTGLFSKQSFLIFIAILSPILVNIIITFKIINLPIYYTSIAFTITATLLWFSIAKYQFLNLTPIAMQTVLDRMTDSFVVINEDQKITYHSKSFAETFKLFNPKLMSNLCKIFRNQPGYQDFAGRLEEHLQMVKVSGKPLSFEPILTIDNSERYFQVEVIPIIISETNTLWGLLIFFKDITQIHKANEIINQNQAMLMEQQHLASLGQLIGGIAHNLRTPIMSISGGLESLRDLVLEYQSSIGDNNVTENDHLEIAAEMLSRIDKTKPFCSYMSDVISAVKDQAVRLNESSMNKFMVSELLKRIELLMKHELKKGHCVLSINNLLSPETEIPGTMNNLIQILGNIIINAIEVYDDTAGKIDLTVEPCAANPGNVRISIRDYGPGLPEKVRDKLFKEMITTKGSKGTGLGLYLSFITIKGKFGGKMWFESGSGQGTTFHISIPYFRQI